MTLKNEEWLFVGDYVVDDHLYIKHLQEHIPTYSSNSETALYIFIVVVFIISLDADFQHFVLYYYYHYTSTSKDSAL